VVVNLGKTQVLVRQQTEPIVGLVDAKGPALYLFQDGPYFLRLYVCAPAGEGSEDYITGA